MELLSLTRANGLIPQSQNTNASLLAEDLSNYKVCHPSDIVMNRMQAWSGMFAIPNQEGIVSPDYSVFKSTTRCEIKLFEYLFKSPALIEQFAKYSKGIGTGFNRLYSEEFGNIKIPFPAPLEQAAIVRYLDDADQRIRAYVSAKERLIALLEEERQAIIQQAVTRGLDGNFRLKPSGVEWMGEVPEHWKEQQVKRIVKIKRGKFTHRPRNDPSLYDGPYPFIQTGDIARATKTITGFKQTLNHRGLAVSTIFPAGTLVMTIAANIGDVAILNFDACFPDSVVGFIPNNVQRDYLYYMLQAMKDEFLLEAPVNTQGNLNVDRIGSMKVALPPGPEQTTIVEYLERITNSTDDTIRRAAQQIELMEEYRTRLIADVVTGKLDVREAAKRLPEESRR